MDKLKLITKVKLFPDTPGVYLMRDSHRKILYIGKATSLKRRVISYFQRPQEARIEKMLEQVRTIETRKTDSVVEALFLESDLIKKYKPKYNIKCNEKYTAIIMSTAISIMYYLTTAILMTLVSLLPSITASTMP